METATQLREKPDSQLAHILSFLEVRITGVWLIRWQHICSKLPKLEFGASWLDMDAPNFVSWVNRSVDIRNESFASDVDAWVEFCVKNKVKTLILKLSTSRKDKYYTAPQVMYSSSSLTTLHLVGCIMMPYQGAIEWNSLADLSLINVELNQHTLDQILSTCPVLKNLLLTSCRGFNRLKVNSEYLDSLTIQESEDGPLVEISAPYIRSLDIARGRTPLQLINISAIVAASIDLFELDGENSEVNVKDLFELDGDNSEENVKDLFELDGDNWEENVKDLFELDGDNSEEINVKDLIELDGDNSEQNVKDLFELDGDNSEQNVKDLFELDGYNSEEINVKDLIELDGDNSEQNVKDLFELDGYNSEEINVKDLFELDGDNSEQNVKDLFELDGYNSEEINVKDLFELDGDNSEQNVKDFLENFKHVNDLYVRHLCFQVVSKMALNGWQLPQFSVQHLRIDSSTECQLSIAGIICLLESSSNVETLFLNVFQTKVVEISDMHHPAAAKGDLDGGDLLHLKKITFNYFFNPIGEPLLTLASILLRRAPALEEMVIVVYDCLQTSDYINLCQALLTYPRSSSNARIHISRR